MKEICFSAFERVKQKKRLILFDFEITVNNIELSENLDDRSVIFGYQSLNFF